MDAVKVHIIGHSFVSRLKQFIRSEPDLRYDFGLATPAMVQYNGYPGGTIRTVHKHLEVVSDFAPDIVVVLLGTNDIYDANVTIKDVANQFHSLLETLIHGFKVPTVVVCQVLHRTPATVATRYPVNYESFNSRVDQLNILLGQQLPQLLPGRAFLWRMKGFWSPDSKLQYFSPDGCHLSRDGQFRLLTNIRAAIVAAMRKTIHDK